MAKNQANKQANEQILLPRQTNKPNSKTWFQKFFRTSTSVFCYTVHIQYVMSPTLYKFIDEGFPHDDWTPLTNESKPNLFLRFGRRNAPVAQKMRNLQASAYGAETTRGKPQFKSKCLRLLGKVQLLVSVF